MYKVGIDPGWSNLGLVVLDKDNKKVFSINMTPSEHKTIAGATQAVEEQLGPYWKGITSAAIEKYVVYGKGVPSKAGIDTTMMVGALQYMFHLQNIEPQIYRAIDWKTSVCKDLFKKTGFKNPSEKFDKKFSLAVAEHICGEKFATDHEADAAGLAYQSAIGK